MSEVWKNSAPALRDFLFWLQKKKLLRVSKPPQQKNKNRLSPISKGIAKKTIAEGWASFF